jgi:tyrosyl-tRNA synthetase
MYLHGYNTVSLVGGSTAKVGDPTGRLTTRANTEAKVRMKNTEAMMHQLKMLWPRVDAYGKKYGYNRESPGKMALWNNDSWMQGLKMMKFLLTIGTRVRMGAMLARET